MREFSACSWPQDTPFETYGKEHEGDRAPLAVHYADDHYQAVVEPSRDEL